MAISEERQAIIEKIAQYEKNGWFDRDVEADPETRTLMPDEIDYTKKKLSSKLATKLANVVAKNYYEKQIRRNQLIISNVVGLENVEKIKTGMVLTCNHFSVNDNYAVYRPLRKIGHKRLFKVIREGNYTSFGGIFGYFFRNCYTLPLSSNMATMKKFFHGCDELLGNGEVILIYPEQAMWYNYRKPRPLKAGAFKIAVRAKVPVVPAFITMKDSDILDQDGNFVQQYTIHYLEPIYPRDDLNDKQNCQYMMQCNSDAWVKLYEEVYGEPLTFSCDEPKEVEVQS